MDSLEQITSQMNSLKQQLQERGVELFKPYFKKFFDENPELVAIRWKQYTELGVRSAELKFTNTEEDAGDYEDGFEESWSLKTKVKTGVIKKDWQGKDCEEVKYEKNERSLLADFISDFLRDNSEACEMAFGDHAQITVTPESIEVEEYEHD